MGFGGNWRSIVAIMGPDYCTHNFHWIFLQTSSRILGVVLSHVKKVPLKNSTYSLRYAIKKQKIQEVRKAAMVWTMKAMEE